MARLFTTTTTTTTTTKLLLGLLLGLAATASAHEIVVQDGFVDAAEASQLAATVPKARPAIDCYSQPVNVPTSLYARLVAAFAPADEAKEAVAAAAAVGAETVEMPGRSERGHVRPHQDRWAQSGHHADTTVGLVYLQGDGQLAFTHKETGEETVVDVKPGRLLQWDNAAYTHTLVAGSTARAMIGPMAFAKGAFHQVGDEPVELPWGTNTQLCAKNMLPKAGSLVKLSATVVPTAEIQFRRSLETATYADLVINMRQGRSLEATAAAAGQVSFVRATLTGKGLGKIYPTQNGDVVTFTIPTEKVKELSALKLTYTYRLAKDVPKGTDFTFILTTGGPLIEEESANANYLIGGGEEVTVVVN